MREYDTGKMFTFLRGFCAGGDYPEITAALGFMRRKHAGQTRRSSGQPYIVHPLTMTCYAISIGLQDDALLAAILLHDVVEDTGVPLEGLPCGEKVRKAVKYMTFTKLPGEEKPAAKAREKSTAGIIKNVYETHYLLLPVLQEAKEKWPDFANPFHALKYNLRALNNTLAYAHGINLYDDPVADLEEGVKKYLKRASTL